VNSAGTVGVLRRRRLVLYTALAVVLVPLLTFVYTSATPGSYSSTAHIAVFTGGPDSLIPSTQITGRRLYRYLATLRSFRVAEDAVQRLPGPPPPDRPAFVKASAEIRRKVATGLDRGARTLEVTARSSSSGQAATLANAFAGGLLQVEGAQAQYLARVAVTELLDQTAGLPPGSRARRGAIAALRRRLVPVLSERQVQVVQPAEPAARPLLTTAVAAAIALIAILAALLLTGVWRPRVESAEP
jgi:hypothetical protein